MPPKKKKEAPEPEPVPVEEAEQEVVEDAFPKPVDRPRTLFDDLPAIWKLPTIEKQKAAIKALFSLETEPVHCGPKAMHLDACYSHLLFANKCGLSSRQTEALFGIMTKVQNRIAEEENLTVQECFAYFRELLVDKSIYRTPDPIEETSEADAAETTTTPTTTTTPAPPAPPALNPGVFVLDNIKLITDYAQRGIFGQFQLYRAVFNRKVFNELTKTVEVPVHLHTVVPDAYSLEDSTDTATVVRMKTEAAAEKARLKKEQEEEQRRFEDEQRQKAEEKKAEEDRLAADAAAKEAAERPDLSDDLLAVLAEQAAFARADMERMLTANAARLDSKLAKPLA